MENLKTLFEENLNTDFIAATLSSPRTKGGAVKVKVRPLLKKGTLFFQLEEFKGNQAFHRNLPTQEACAALLACMEEMKQLQMETRSAQITALVSKKGKVTVKKKARKEPAKEADLSHNRQKRYILEEGTPVPFLVDLGVMTPEGKVVHARFDKFRQINRFLEFIEDILPRLVYVPRMLFPRGDPLNTKDVTVSWARSSGSSAFIFISSLMTFLSHFISFGSRRVLVSMSTRTSADSL